MARTLTENQQKFLDVLFEEAAGDVVLAKKLAGYSEGSSTTTIVASLKDEIFQFFMDNAAPAVVNSHNFN